MLKFPVNVSISSNGKYVATIADIENSPTSINGDPHLAYENLIVPAKKLFAEMHKNDTLPSPSNPSDRPTIPFEENHLLTADSQVFSPINLTPLKTKKNMMIGYVWTNFSAALENTEIPE
jgi:hypothetical protein